MILGSDIAQVLRSAGRAGVRLRWIFLFEREGGGENRTEEGRGRELGRELNRELNRTEQRTE